jgi:hypothetical protein
VVVDEQDPDGLGVWTHAIGPRLLAATSSRWRIGLPRPVGRY